MLDRGYVDSDRLYVTAGSGGGVLTARIVGHTDRFRAAVSARPLINGYSRALSADMYVTGIPYWFPGPPLGARRPLHAAVAALPRGGGEHPPRC